MTAAAASWPSSRVSLIIDTRVIDFTYGRKRENRQKRMSEVHEGDTRRTYFQYSFLLMRNAISATSRASF